MFQDILRGGMFQDILRGEMFRDSFRGRMFKDFFRGGMCQDIFRGEMFRDIHSSGVDICRHWAAVSGVQAGVQDQQGGVGHWAAGPHEQEHQGST